MIRNPVDAICSAFHMHVVNGLEKITDLEYALNAEKQQLNNHIFYQNRVRYSSRISQYIDVFGRKNLFIIIFDDFKVNTKYVYREALKFLEVNSNICPNFRIYNPARSGRNYKIIRYFSKYPRLKRFLLSHIDKKRRDFILDMIPPILGNEKSPTPIIRQSTKNRLKEELKSEVEDLSKLLNRDLSHWGIPK